MRLTSIALLALASILVGGAGTARADTAWLTADAAAALEQHDVKVSDQFEERLEHVLPDGTLRVLVATERQDEQVRDFVAGATTWVKWYGDDPRFMARVTPAQLVTLLDSPVIDFLEPDYKLVALMSGATLDTHVRSLGGDGSGIWTFGNGPGPLGALLADAGTDLTPDLATGRGVTTAVIDSGIDRTHQDFGGWDCARVAYDPCESRLKHEVTVDHILGDGWDGDLEVLPTTELASGHGTHVAGIIAGNGYYTRQGGPDAPRYGGDGYVFGVAPQSDLVSIKNGDVIWAGLSSFGMQWVLDHGKEYGIRAINNSWGCLTGCEFNPNGLTARLTRDLYEAGFLVAFAAGNGAGGENGAAFSGNAQSPYTLGVANYDHVTHQLSDSSSRGLKEGNTTLADPATWTPGSEPATGRRRPDVAAPGENIWAARNLTGGAAAGPPRVNLGEPGLGGRTGFVPYAIMSGTSMATPHVVGAAALMFSTCPTATPLDVMRAVMVGADPFRVLKTGATTIAEPFEVGYGGLDARRSLDYLRTLPKCAGANQAPTAAISAPDSVRNFEVATFDGSGSSDADGSIASYEWDLGDGTTAAGPTVEHAYDWPGTYTVELTVTDDDGAVGTAARTVTVRDEPAPGLQRVEADRDSVKCSSSAWELTISHAGASAPARVAVKWANGDRALVPLTSSGSNSATYRTTANLQSALTSGRADLPTDWKGKFELASGPFCAKK